MKKHEERAQKTGKVLMEDNSVEDEAEKNLPVSKAGTLIDLILPIAVLLVATIAVIFWTGINAFEGEDKALMDIFGEADVNYSLLVGGAISLIVVFLMFIKHIIRDRLTGRSFVSGFVAGIKSMLPALFILIFACTIVDLIYLLCRRTFLVGLFETSYRDL